MTHACYRKRKTCVGLELGLGLGLGIGIHPCLLQEEEKTCVHVYISHCPGYVHSVWLQLHTVCICACVQVIFSENPMEPRKLRVYSITAKCYRDLPETQEINFKTTPSFMQQYLPDILKYIQNPCPLHVAMYRNPLGRPLVAPGIPSTMFRRPLYLKKRYTDILLIATGCSGDGGTEDSQPFEIPTDIDVDFEVIKLSPEEKEELKEESHALLEKLKDKDVRHHRCVCEWVDRVSVRCVSSLYRYVSVRCVLPIQVCGCEV